MKNNWTLILLSIIAATFPSQCSNSSPDYTPSSDQYLLGLAKHFHVLNSVNVFDGPCSISNAPTKPATTKKPTLEQMMYYNYYTSSVYCAYNLKQLDCEYCQKFRNDVTKHAVLRCNIHNTLALVTLSEKREEIVVTYRGTINVWNFVLDAFMINSSIGSVNGTRIHRGFYIATMSLYKKVITCVGYLRSLKPEYKSYKIVICGHSMGAAMARITQYFLHSLNQFPGCQFEVYTYGEPRTGNKAYVDYLNNQTDVTARIVARADIVSHYVPTSVLAFKLIGDYYLHVQTEYWINGKEGQRFCNQTVYEDPSCSMSLGPLYSLVDHLTYFDTDSMKCIASNPLQIISVPLVFEPTKFLPPLPQTISHFLGSSCHFVVHLLSKIFG